ncbi:CocE/NonD family hydrolase [Microbacterium sp. QXD-8]|uniref:CocE/NonD family hydrolase n=1 Tax=Microbacterium psychrotolerans TaxID=3068321 RepID=A0ABU0Z6F0_9MICO|nr:CocE/NonD family hydrolase [Microbacterium sp. QXD-8]MDQ7880178.1 CocE/NonD family hydrolase [Microbacterium sp. QXD-8]
MRATTPWHRPGAVGYALARVRGILRPPVTVHPPGDHLRADRDVPIEMPDGVVLRANVYRGTGEAPTPVILCAHPYGKDVMPVNSRSGRRLNFQFRMLRQPAPVRISAETSWEAPDPDWWTSQGYAVVNLDVRGAGTSGGRGAVLSDQEADDIRAVVDWIADQPWCDGNVGMLGVSYLAISQYKVAALQPTALRAIVPWEGFTDAYRDLFYPGGVREIGFSRIWTTITRRTTRQTVDIGARARARSLDDEWWRSLAPDLERILVPMLVCGSFSDNNLHSRGSMRAFAHASSAERHLYTHRGGKWTTFSGHDARAAQKAFLDRHLKRADIPALPPVRLEIRDRGDHVVEIRDEQEWPLARTQWTTLALTERDGNRVLTASDVVDGWATFAARRRALSFRHVFERDTEVTGPMSAQLCISRTGGHDLPLFVAVSKESGGRFVPFEGSYGFGRDFVTTGWQDGRFRDQTNTDPHIPDHDYRARRPVHPGEIVKVRIELGPSATLFRAGEALVFHVSGRQLSPRNPLTGAFPALYRSCSRGTRYTVHWSRENPSHLVIPIIPAPHVTNGSDSATSRTAAPIGRARASRNGS